MIPTLAPQLSETRYLVGMCDASPDILASTFHLVCHRTVHGITTATTMVLPGPNPTGGDGSRTIQGLQGSLAQMNPGCESTHEPVGESLGSDTVTTPAHQPPPHTSSSNDVNFNLLCQIHLANSKVKSLPLLELHAYTQMCQALDFVITTLQFSGLGVDPKNVVLLSDSVCNLMWQRSLHVRYSRRVEHLLSLCYLSLDELGLNNFQNLFWVDQKSLSVYSPDVLTKPQSFCTKILDDRCDFGVPQFLSAPRSTWPVTQHQFLPSGRLHDTHFGALETTREHSPAFIVQDATAQHDSSHVVQPQRINDGRRVSPQCCGLTGGLVRASVLLSHTGTHRRIAVW